MKTLLIILISFCALSFLQAQELEKLSKAKAKYEYCEILSKSRLLSSKPKITVDFGQAYSFWKDKRVLKDENGKAIQFNSSIDALNYMASFGWELVNTYSIIDSDDYKTFYYVLKRELTEEEKEGDI
ncbi:MAG: hypothetical protein ACI35V_07170 [Sphingobacterium composti]|uniref:hypothetical protein n=1 Tax=Sphingobacterium composti TaxID=363260 RepID=UPI001357B4AD|nr:hypothetical protein [Sphingobacterium composti Ten et al. 2007 non Yoo et al. 2007]